MAFKNIILESPVSLSQPGMHTKCKVSGFILLYENLWLFSRIKSVIGLGYFGSKLIKFSSLNNLIQFKRITLSLKYLLLNNQSS